MTVAMDLDIAYEGETLDEAITDLLAKAYDDVSERPSYAVIDESGPGGGWPVVRFIADDGQALWPLALAYANGDEDEATMFCDRQEFVG